MTTVEEELLLSEPVANDYDSLAAIDVDLLLGAGDVSRKPTSTDDATAALLLDSVEHAPEQDSEQVPGLRKKIETGEDIESEKEELDYDEEEDDDDGRRERTSRYTSERKGASRQSSEDGGSSKKENGDRKAKRPGIPSLFDKTITSNPMKSGDQPIGVILRIEGEAERIFYPPPSFMMQLHQQNQPIVPRLPNGIPLIGMPSNHGRAGFGVGYQQNQQPQPHGRLVGGGGIAVMPGQWDNEVERFLSSTNSRGVAKKRRSASYSSLSSYSSDSRSRSRSSSRSERRKRDEKRRRRDDRRYERRDERESVRRDDRRGADFRRGEDKRRHDDKRARERDSHSEHRRKEQSKKSAIESAKALGLSHDYIERVNEQKRQRDELIKKKEERRYCPSSSETRDRKEASVASTSSSAHKDSISLIKDKGTKAYLAVNVCGVQQLTTAVKKIEALANEMGPIKICWRSADDVVSIIFNAHDKAKDFMIKYNGKVLSGLRITVSLEKKFLNLAELN